jgi:hypothetical protein
MMAFPKDRSPGVARLGNDAEMTFMHLLWIEVVDALDTSLNPTIEVLELRDPHVARECAWLFGLCGVVRLRHLLGKYLELDCPKIRNPKDPAKSHASLTSYAGIRNRMLPDFMRPRVETTQIDSCGRLVAVGILVHPLAEEPSGDCQASGPFKAIDLIALLLAGHDVLDEVLAVVIEEAPNRHVGQSIIKPGSGSVDLRRAG